MKPLVSVVIIVKNVEQYITNCLVSVLNQNFNRFEVVIIDDLSSDSTQRIISDFNDKRIRYFRNEEWLGISKSRNVGLAHARGEYIFFTDGDCRVSVNWIEEGLKHLKDPDSAGVEGRIYYVSEFYEPNLSDNVMENRWGGNFMTGNVAYKKSVIKNVGGFDENLTYFEDRDFALRAIKYGKIRFNPRMIVYHPKVLLTPKKYLQTASRLKNRVHLFKRFGERKFMLWRIFFPANLVKIFFPPLIFLNLFSTKFRNSDDLKLLPYMYIYAISQRIQLWKECAKERVFLI